MHPYDIIFMDIGLPDIRGTKVIAEIRNSDLITRDIPIIILTAYLRNEIEKECVFSGANAVLNKPVTSENFKDILEKYVAR